VNQLSKTAIHFVIQTREVGGMNNIKRCGNEKVAGEKCNFFSHHSEQNCFYFKNNFSKK